MNRLAKMTLRGFKSIRALEDFSFGPRTVLIGGNGAGKSNLISFFRLLRAMVSRGSDGLQFYVGKAGGANVLLYDGASVTSQIDACLSFEIEDLTLDYQFQLSHAAPDTLIFADELIRWGSDHWLSLGRGHREAILNVTRLTTQLCAVYQFHNSSETARIRQRWDKEDNGDLKEDGANLAPVLLRLRETKPKRYAQIRETVRQILPFFRDFVLEPVKNSVFLQWRERGSDVVFGAHQASDGMLRTLALVTLLLQPKDQLPEVLILDEPELGLHPYAISVVAGLIRSVSLHTQVILATQSVTLVDYFDPEDIIVVDRPDRESVFRRLDPEALSEWLKEYSLGELWEKNVLGGRPGR